MWDAYRADGRCETRGRAAESDGSPLGALGAMRMCVFCEPRPRSPRHSDSSPGARSAGARVDEATLTFGTFVLL